MDHRISLLAKNLINYSTALKSGEKILIEIFDDAHPLAKALIEECYKVKALPFISIKHSQLQRRAAGFNCSIRIFANGKYGCLYRY